MISSRDFRLFSVQAVAFTTDWGDSKFRTSRVISSVLPEFNDRYNGEVDSVSESPKPIGVAAGASVEISLGVPHVSLSSEDGRWTYQANPERADSFWIAQDVDDQTTQLGMVSTRCVEPLLHYPIQSDARIGRLALVVRRMFPTDNGANSLAQEFCTPALTDESNENAPLRHSREFQLHNLKRFPTPFEGVTANSWVRCMSKTLNDTSGIAIEQDINTLQEEAQNRAFGEAEIRSFFDWAVGEMNHIVGLYFPADART